MKNIIWMNLFLNIIRCIIVYPIGLIVFIITFIPAIIDWAYSGDIYFVVVENLKEFHKYNLYPIKRSYNVVDPMDMFNKTLEKINRS